MDDFLWEHPMLGSSIFILLVLGLTLGVVAFLDYKHQEYLKKNGCQLYSDKETGHLVYCGKACYRQEHIRIYDCFKGRKIEID